MDERPNQAYEDNIAKQERHSSATLSLMGNTPHEQYRTFVSNGTLKIGLPDLSDDIISPLTRVMSLKNKEVIIDDQNRQIPPIGSNEESRTHKQMDSNGNSPKELEGRRVQVLTGSFNQWTFGDLTEES